MSLDRARTLLFGIWISLGGLAILIFFVFTLTGKFGERIDDAWGWLIPHLGPTLTFVTAAKSIKANKSSAASKIPPGIGYAAMATSVIYLLAILIVILGESISNQYALALYQTSNISLGVFQSICLGLVATAI